MFTAPDWNVSKLMMWWWKFPRSPRSKWMRCLCFPLRTYMWSAGSRVEQPRSQTKTIQYQPKALSSPDLLLLCIFLGFSGICQLGSSGPPPFALLSLHWCRMKLSDSAPHQPTHSPNRFGESAAKEPLVIDDIQGECGGVERGGCGHSSRSPPQWI